MGDFIAILLDRAYGDRISLSPKGGGESSNLVDPSEGSISWGIGGGGEVPISLILVKV